MGKFGRSDRSVGRRIVIDEKGKKQPLRRFLLVCFSCLLFVPLLTVSASATISSVEITGHGWGHGRGMGQYGSLGYANLGWSSDKILAHYYSNTTSGTASKSPIDSKAVRVNLMSMQSWPTTVALDSGSIIIKSKGGVSLDSYSAGAVRLVQKGDGYDLQRASSCSGPWKFERSFDNHSELQIHKSSSATGRSGLLEVCSSSRSVWYKGYVIATRNSSGNARTINVVSAEDYLRGVVPNEMPASWPKSALKTQAVAARSYLMAGDTRFTPYADTCDTTRCQVYDGIYTTRGGLRLAVDSRTDAAIEATKGQVRVFSSGKVARTEFSSSTGGYTKNGDFPAVEDKGDSVSSNPNHDWKVTVNLGSLESKYGKGSTQAIVVTERDGMGDGGGRATKVEYRFSRGTVTVTGDKARQDLGLKSDWFFINGKKGETAPSVDPTAAYIQKTYKIFLGRNATSSEVAEWSPVVNGGDKKSLTKALSDSEVFAGDVVDSLYRSALGRKADASGRRYWVAQLADGLPLARVGVYFYGSSEYKDRSGGTNASFVNALYNNILSRSPDANGEAYWISQLATRRANLDDVADGFYQSVESRHKRAVAMHKRIVGTTPTNATAEALAKRLLIIDDLELASELAVDLL